MKVGDLVKWHKDGYIGLILGFVQQGASEDDACEGNPIITWSSWGFQGDVDCSVRVWDEGLEVISESR